jgi:hypothetical protein
MYKIETLSLPLYECETSISTFREENNGFYCEHGDEEEIWTKGG